MTRASPEQVLRAISRDLQLIQGVREGLPFPARFIWAHQEQLIPECSSPCSAFLKCSHSGQGLRESHRPWDSHPLCQLSPCPSMVGGPLLPSLTLDSWKDVAHLFKGADLSGGAGCVRRAGLGAGA